MTLSIKMDCQIPEEGRWHAEIDELRLIKKASDDDNYKLKIKFLVDCMDVEKEVDFIMNANTELNEIIKAVNNGVVPYHIQDLEKFLIGNEVELDIVYETNKNNVTYVKVGKVYPLDEDELIENKEVDLYEDEYKYSEMDYEFYEESNVEKEVDFDFIDYSEIDNSMKKIGTRKRKRRTL